MALFIANGNGGAARILYTNPTEHHPYTHHHHHNHRPLFFPLSPKRPLHLVSAKKVSSSSRIGRFDSKNRRASTTTKDQEDGQEEKESEDGNVSKRSSNSSKVENVGGVADVEDVDDGYFLPELPGDEPDFWEGEQWDGLGFFVQYMWAFGIAFALIACGIAVVTYNEGATDFKETPAYKESIESQELLENPEASNSDVFESNPTEVAPTLE